MTREQQLQDRIAVVTRASIGIGAATFVLIRPRTHLFLELAFRLVIETPQG